RPPETTLRLSLLAADESAAQPPREFSKLPPSGKVGCVVDLQGLARGRYRLAAELTVPGHEQVAAEQALTLPLAATPVPAPPRQVVPPLPAPPVAPKLTLTHELGGGFTVTVGGKPFRCGSSYSFPHGGENLLAPGAVCRTGEPEWRVSLKQLGHRRTIEAAGKYYRITRRCDLDGPIVRVFDEITNLTNGDLGLIIDHHLEVGDRPFRQRWVAGYPTALERTQPRSPSSFVAWADLGLGLLPLDDVSIVHSTCYARDDRVGFRDEMFGLAAGQSHVVEWQVHVVGPSPGRAGAGAAPPDYYSFINQVRAAEQRYQTVEGGFAFIPRDGITPEHAELRNLTYASFPCLGRSPDDPGSAVEGIDFLWLPKLRAQLTQQFAAIRQARPGLKLMFHIAHSLVSTCPAENRFPDSRVLDRDGKHVIYGYSYGPNGPFSPERHEAGWRWFIFYPTPGNSFHEALLQSADCLVDDIGCSGAFMDGFLGGYGSPWTYDRWDGHTVEMDPQTKTIKRKPASVLLLSQPSMAAFVRRMTARGAVVLANNVVMTRTMGKLPMIVDQEMTSGPDVDLAQTPCALGNYVNIKEEADVYLDALDKLRWGNLYFHYGEGKLTHPTLTAQQFPITVRQVSAGMIRGDERIITMHPGVYGWPGSRDLHRVYRYNEIGWLIAAGLVTTVDQAGVRTQVDLAADESAVVKHIPVQLQCAAAGNVMVTRYDSEAISLQINGRGKATLLVRNGDFAIAAEREYTVSVNTIERQVKADKDGVLRVPLTLTGPVSVTIAGG
ncbi:MAG: hypothetical protein KKI08_20500, partial [Armatimonadetes bacterium]|nr:hypothetical protein [Armatimonadota bacterium]